MMKYLLSATIAALCATSACSDTQRGAAARISTEARADDGAEAPYCIINGLCRTAGSRCCSGGTRPSNCSQGLGRCCGSYLGHCFTNEDCCRNFGCYERMCVHT
jgi:hypothetical protein